MRVTPHEALAAVRAKRDIVSPNMGFLRQLDEYAAEVQGGGRSSGRRLRSSKVGDNVAEAIRKLTNGSQKELISTSTVPMTPSSSSSR